MQTIFKKNLKIITFVILTFLIITIGLVLGTKYLTTYLNSNFKNNISVSFFNINIGHNKDSPKKSKDSSSEISTNIKTDKDNNLTGLGGSITTAKEVPIKINDDRILAKDESKDDDLDSNQQKFLGPMNVLAQNSELIKIQTLNKNIDGLWEINYYYDHKNSPEKLTYPVMQTILQSANLEWRNCGVVFKNLGYKERNLYLDADNTPKLENIISWVDLDDEGTGAATWRPISATKNQKPYLIELDFDVFNAQPETLYSTIVHEFGHVIGLEHSRDKKSVMFRRINEQNQAFTLSAVDLKECNNIVKKWGQP